MEPTDETTPRLLAKLREEINQRLERVEGDIRGMRGDIHGMREDIHGVREDMHGMREDIHVFVTALDARDRRFAADRSDLHTRIEACERDIAELKRRVEPGQP